MITLTNPFAALPILAAATLVSAGLIVSTPAHADGGCIPGNIAGQVPRNARPGDNVCVLPNIAALVQQENANRNAGYKDGTNPKDLICKSGLVYRETFDGDGVCVTPARRAQTFQENANAGTGNTGGLKPQAGITPGGGPAAQGTGGPDTALLAAINEARLHPEKYPPHGDTSGATMTACTNPLLRSGALENTAATHNSFIATMAKNALDPHRTPTGGYQWDAGGPIDRAGYSAGRWEIVAAGQSSVAGALQDWMQDDGPGSGNTGDPWGHRNTILNCSIQGAGGAHFVGGPWSNYWTVDMGNH